MRIPHLFVNDRKPIHNYVRYCRRCGKKYITTARHSKFCGCGRVVK